MKLPKFSKALRRIGRMLRGAAFGVAFGACSVGLSFGGLGFGLSEGSSVVQTPLTLPGFAALSIWLNAAKNITLGGTMKSTGFVAGGVVTLTGTLAQTTTSCVPRVVVQTTGTVGVFTFNLSTDGGQTYTFGITSAATYLIPGTAITINFAAGTYNAGAVYEATVSQIVSQDTNAWVFASSTAGNSPIITYFNGRPALKFDGTSILRCSTAGVAAVFAGDDLPYTFFVSAQPSSLTSLKTFLSAANTAGGNPFINFFTNGALWQINKHDNGGTTGDVSGGVPVIDTLYTLEGFSTGTAASLIANGATVINAAAQNVGTCSSANCVSIGATNLSNTPGNFGNCYLNEVIVYSGNQHAVAGTTTTAYLNTRNAALASTAIADSFFFDNKAVTQGTSPSTVAPNDYKQRDPFARLKGTVGAGVTSLTVWAVPSLDPVGTEGSFTRVGVWIDGVYSQTLTFAGALGLRQSQVLSLDGSAHTIEFENQASIVGIDGAIALSSSAVPNTRVIVRGDSISIGHNASSTPYKGWTAIMRHALAQATYGTTRSEERRVGKECRSRWSPYH